jgi:hypothetical protein
MCEQQHGGGARSAELVAVSVCARTVRGEVDNGDHDGCADDYCSDDCSANNVEQSHASPGTDCVERDAHSRLSVVPLVCEQPGAANRECFRKLGPSWWRCDHAWTRELQHFVAVSVVRGAAAADGSVFQRDLERVVD